MNGIRPKGTYVIRRSYSNPSTMAEAMREEGVMTIKAGRRIHYSQASMSRFKTGAKRMPLEAAIGLVEKMRSPFLAIDVANKTIQVSAPVINGDDIVKEPLAMAIRSVAEMSEAITAVNSSLDELTTPVNKVKDNRDPVNAIDQLLDVMLYATNSVAFISQEYGVSMQYKLATRTLEWRRLGGLVGN